MKLNKKEKELAYSLLSDVNETTTREREYELYGIVKTMLSKKYLQKEDIKNIRISFSGGQIEIAPKTVLANEPYFGWCDVERCENEGCSGGMAWRDTGYWTYAVNIPKCTEKEKSNRK